jgi:integrase
MMRLYILPAIGSHKLSEITAPMVRETMQELYRRGRAMGTIKLAFAVMHRCFDAAIDDGYLKESPVPKFSKLRLADAEGAQESAKRQALTAGQVIALLNACDDDPALKLWTAIMASCGLRPGEANGLRWQDINVKTGELHIRGAAKKVYGPNPGEGSRVWIGKTKTPSSKRQMTIGPMLAALFAAEQERQEAIQRQLIGLPANVATTKRLVPGEGCVFPADPTTAQGLRSPCSPDSLSGRFRRAAIRAGLPHVSPHWLRHTAISHSLAEGTPLADASQRAGHKNPAITAAIYTHVVGEGEKKASAIGDRLLSPSAPAEIEQLASDKGPRNS